MSDKLLEWAEKQAYYKEGYSMPHYSPFVCHIMNLLDKRVRECNCVCEWVSPYGFVPEAGCSKHD